MSKIGQELIEGMNNALAHFKGDSTKARRVTTVTVKVPERIDVAGIRKKLGMSQALFAATFGFSVKNIRNWEQGQRQPDGPARAYLTVIAREPKAVRKALAA